MDRLGHCIDSRLRREGYRCAVLFLDLDRFKVINDSLGHAVGDQLLIQAGQRIAACLRPNDTLARLGGDEFAILIDDVKEASNAVRVAQRIQEELEAPVDLGNREVYSSASIGIALSGAGTAPEEILRDADTAMYRAKAQGRAGHAIFDARMHAEVRAQLRLETDLRRAVSQHQFEVYYQPIVLLRTGELTGFEALVRWRHPERGLVLPCDFIQVAEEAGLGSAIGHEVLAAACREAQTWNDSRTGAAPLEVSVNLSRRQLEQPHFLDRLSEVLRATGLPGHLLFVEVNESILMADLESGLARLEEVKRRGVRICLDDFGTGYSSLAVLHRFPFDRIKIDRWFVRNVGVDHSSDGLVSGVLSLCHGRRFDTLAEGVETERQRQRLSDLGCDFAQGFLFSEPVDKMRAAELAAGTETLG